MARRQFACENLVNPLTHVPAFSSNTKTSPQGHAETHHITHEQPSEEFVSLSPSSQVSRKTQLLLLLPLLLLSRNTVWVLTQILKYLRAASLSCFAVKWLPLHQWNNNWYDNRFIWAPSRLWCYFVEWGVKVMAASRHFLVCVRLRSPVRLYVGRQR